MRKTLLIILLCSSASMCYATDTYFAQVSAGANDGSSCANAKAVSTWAASFGSDNKQHLCGAITSQLTTGGSGTSGHPDTILFETGASMQISPGCSSAGCLAVGSNSFIIIDGGTGQPCGWNTVTNLSEGSCNGQIENMLYGSPGASCPGGACTTQPAQDGLTGNLIYGTGAHDIEVRNLQLGPSYIHTSSGSGLTDSGGTQCTQFTNSSNINIHDNKAHDGVWCIVFAVTGTNSKTNLSYTNNEIYNSSHMSAIGMANTAQLNGFTMAGNYTHDMSNWDTTADDNHGNALHTYSDAGGGTTITNGSIYNNILGGHMGQDATSQLFMEAANGTETNLNIFNNLLINLDTSSTASERLLFVNVCMSGCHVFNNTMVGPNTGWGWTSQLGSNGSTTTAFANYENNINSDASTIVQCSFCSFGTIDYNVYGLQGSFVWNGHFMDGFTGATCGPTNYFWNNCSGEGTHSQNLPSGINLAANYHPNSGSPVITAGDNLTSLCTGLGISGNPCLFDLAGVARPNSAWDVGAYQFAGAPPPTVSAPNSAIFALLDNQR